MVNVNANATSAIVRLSCNTSGSASSASVCDAWWTNSNGEPTGFPAASFRRRVTTTAYVVRSRNGTSGFTSRVWLSDS